MEEEPMECVPFISEGWDIENNYPRLENSDRIDAIVYMTGMPISLYGPPDCETLKELWRTLGFADINIRVLQDPTRNQLMKWVSALAVEINVKSTRPDSFNFAFIGHGNNKEEDIASEYMVLKEELGKPNIFSVKELIDIFAAYNCPGLATIPKFYLFQCCRGGRKEFPVQLTPASGSDDCVAPMSDILCLHGSPPGYVSWYNKSNGRSILVDTVSEVFLKNYKTEDLKSMVESVIKKIEVMDLEGYRQSPHHIAYSFHKRMHFCGIGGSLRYVSGAVPTSRPTGSIQYAVCSSQPNLQLLEASSLKDQGNAELSKGNLIEAIDLYTKAIHWDPDNHVLYSNRSAAYAKKEMYIEALTDGEKTLSIKPDWAKGFYRKGSALSSLCQYTEAVATFEKGLMLDPNNKFMKYRLAYCKAKEKQQYDDAHSKQLMQAVKNGDIKLLEELLIGGIADVNFPYMSLGYHPDFTPLHEACVEGHLAIVQALVAAGADVDVKDMRGETPLHVCSAFGHGAVMQVLLEVGAAVNAKDNLGNSPLHMACIENELALVKLLVAAGAVVNTKNNLDQTPAKLAWAKGNLEGNLEVVQFLAQSEGWDV